MRISDWSSDVCSSDLRGRLRGHAFRDVAPVARSARAGDGRTWLSRLLRRRFVRDAGLARLCLLRRTPGAADLARGRYAVGHRLGGDSDRSEERRVGKEGGSTGRYWWGAAP